MTSLKTLARNVTIGNSALLLLVFFTIFVIPLFPFSSHSLLFNLSYTFLYVMAVLSLEQHRKVLITLAVGAFVLQWVSGLLNIETLLLISKGLNFVFFAIMVLFLILQVAKTRQVTPKVILGAINGYLLLGLVFSIAVAVIMALRPDAYTFGREFSSDPAVTYMSDYLYYGFVTFTTLGYGDIVPTLPFTKSLAILTSITGQIYLAVIIALLVGKFASSRES